MTPVLGLLLHLALARGAQASSKCAELVDSLTVFVAAEPATAVGVARRLYATCRNDADALYGGGRVLNRAARSDSSGKSRTFRDQAERMLARVVALQPKHAAAWLEYGFALRKRGGVPVDADRAIGRALALADQYPDSTPSELLAEIHLLRARYLQHWLNRLRALKDASRLSVYTPSCSDLGLFCENYANPSRFNDQLRDLPAVDPDFPARRERVLGYYRKALRLAPRSAEAVLRYARELALEGEWESLAELAGGIVPGHLDSALLAAVEAMALQRLGRYAAADSLFQESFRGLPDSLRHWYTRPPAGLPAEWNRARPLWVVPFDELRLEYWARVTYAVLVFTDPEQAVYGPATPQGDALVRYGWPTMATQVEREAGKLLSSARRYAADKFLTCIPADVGGKPEECEVSGAQATARDPTGGRWLFWTYGMDRPSLIFEQRPGVRVPRYVREALAEDYSTVLRRESPMTFASRVAPRQFRLPVQVVRFRGARPEETAVSVFGVVPARQMELPPQDSLAVGLFVFRDTVGFPLVTHRSAHYKAAVGIPVSYDLPLEAGRYSYSLEAFAPARGVAGTARDSLTAPVWAAESLLLSDLLIAHRVEPRGEVAPLAWRDLTVEPSRTLEVAKGSSLWAVWEAYGLDAGPEGTVRYEVNLALRDMKARPAPLRLLERLGVGRRQGTPVVALQWSAERRLASDGRALEYVAVQLPEDAEGRYELVVTVTDPVTRRTTKTSRTITIAARSP
ncbi:MAG: hypothetical protein HYS40_04145 [Gemmatimonadetes bacterium]|nr:hypothetical protein [Gemmatimonadota bacterium]